MFGTRGHRRTAVAIDGQYGSAQVCSPESRNYDRVDMTGNSVISALKRRLRGPLNANAAAARES
jgi:hypothetical protein